jgi:non-heme chloroperoxidase
LLIGGCAVFAAASLAARVLSEIRSAEGSTFHNSTKGEHFMGTITTKDGTTIYHKDWGRGQPIVFSHGWPLSSDEWDPQVLFFGQQGYRVIAHDRRGHGRSTQT